MKQKKKVIIIIIVLLIIFTVTVLLLVNNSDDNNETPGNNTNTNIDNSSIEDVRINTLEDEDRFFTLQRIINNYYDIIRSNDAEILYNVLVENYIYNNNITVNNVLSILDNSYEDTSYIAKDIQYIEGENITYYIINGYLLNQIIVTEELQYNSDVNFMVIIKNNTYAIYPLQDVDINEFLERYDFKNDENINFANTYTNVFVVVENKLTTYINEFLTLMFVDSQRAYNMLSDESKDLYGSLDNFNQRLYNIYQSISPVVFSYYVNELDDYVEYDIIDNNTNRITIYEYNTMNYSLNIDFY